MSDPTPEIRLVPLDKIDDAALPRDRTGLDPEPLAELRSSIAKNGLRMPVELYPMEAGDPPYGLISGYRRVWAFRELFETTGRDRFAAIPAIIRPRADLAASLAAMVEENDVRAGISPWEQGNIAHHARCMRAFETVEEAVEKLFPTASRDKRRRIRGTARVVEELDGLWTAPERLSLRQILRLEGAIRAGFAEVIAAALEETRDKDPDNQWRVVEPLLMEAERIPPDWKPPRPGRPRRVHRPLPELTIRREQTREGWCLHFTGREATDDFMDTVFFEIELMFTPVKPQDPKIKGRRD